MRPRAVVAVLSIMLGACTASESALTGPAAPAAGGPSFSHGGPGTIDVNIQYSGSTSGMVGSRPSWNVVATVASTGQPIDYLLVSCYGTGGNGDVFGMTVRTGPDGSAVCEPYPLMVPPGNYEVVIGASSWPYVGGPPMFIFPVGPGPTYMTWTGSTALTADYNGTLVTLAARLTWAPGGLEGALVRLQVNDADGYPLTYCDVQSDWRGDVRCDRILWLSPGPVTLVASYAGDNLRVPSSVSVPVVVQDPPPPPPPPLPTTRQDCMNGGWQQYGVFRNQGDCVSYVATTGRNQPAAQ